MRRQSWPCFKVCHDRYVSITSLSLFCAHSFICRKRAGNLRERQPGNGGTTVPRSPNRTRQCTIDHRERRKRFPGELRISLNCIALCFVIGKSTENILFIPFVIIFLQMHFFTDWFSNEEFEPNTILCYHCEDIAKGAGHRFWMSTGKLE